jgi:circadian clock protein KaiB
MSRDETPGGDDGSVLMLFIAGDSPRSSRARAHLRRALEARGVDPGRIEIVDALREPQRVLEHRIFATPTLTAQPITESVLYGDLSDRDALDRFLDGIFEAA